jgi:spermidine/putrescine transport system ATP-binding protein
MSGPPSSGELLVLEKLSHRYGRAIALDDVSLEIRAGEFLTLLGPSGCGKTTLLRIIAGFIRPSEGRVLLDGRDITRVPPHRRPVNTVFQRPALFPHLDVFENVAFGLRIARLPKEEVESRVAEALALVRLDGYARRRSHELSGGQMQRVSLARALVNRPRLVLLDEPLSALDLKIRLEMEVELRRVHRETRAAFVYVTHDQREGLALSDRIVVLNHGRIEGVGTPGEIYAAAASVFVARFVGNANVIPVEVTAVKGGEAIVELGGITIAAPAEKLVDCGPAWLIVRPEVIRLSEHSPATEAHLSGTVRDLAFRGSSFSYRIEVPALTELFTVEEPAERGAPHPLGSEVALTWEVRSSSLVPRPPPAHVSA